MHRGTSLTRCRRRRPAARVAHTSSHRPVPRGAHRRRPRLL